MVTKFLESVFTDGMRECRQFFGSDAAAIFGACWKPVLAMVSSEIQDQLQAYNDVIGLLIMTRIVGHSQLLMIHAQAPVLDGFLDRVGLMLWPHYSKLIRTHIEAVTPGTLPSSLVIHIVVQARRMRLHVALWSRNRALRLRLLHAAATTGMRVLFVRCGRQQAVGMRL